MGDFLLQKEEQLRQPGIQFFGQRVSYHPARLALPARDTEDEKR